MVNKKDQIITQKTLKDLSVYIVGCGSIGRRHTEVLKSLGIKDIRIYDNDFKKMESLLVEFPDIKTCNTFEDGLKEKPDAVFILTPTKLHLEMIRKSVQNGCHVFSEKPISDSIEGIDELTYRPIKGSFEEIISYLKDNHEDEFESYIENSVEVDTSITVSLC